MRQLDIACWSKLVIWLKHISNIDYDKWREAVNFSDVCAKLIKFRSLGFHGWCLMAFLKITHAFSQYRRCLRNLRHAKTNRLVNFLLFTAMLNANKLNIFDIVIHIKEEKHRKCQIFLSQNVANARFCFCLVKQRKCRIFVCINIENWQSLDWCQKWCSNGICLHSNKITR